ncbi:MAG: hypothetical protein H3C48_04560 [Chitinophagaceae bacterium]|nr:hypothetical protein [Chitinophagaceae bacterium]
MHVKHKWLLSLFLIVFNISLYAQADRIPLGDKQYQLLNRLDIKLQNDSVFSFSTIKPYDRRIYTERVAYIDSLDQAGELPVELSETDRHNIRSLLMNNSDWTKDEGERYLRDKPIWNTFFKTPAHVYETHSKDFTLFIDPVLNLQVGKSSEVNRALYTNTRGVSMRGNIGKKLGFYTYITDNQEQDPLYVKQYVRKRIGIPNAGYFKFLNDDGYDYFDARGGIDFAASKFINFRFGYDKLFIGNGYRSLLLSDFSNNFLYLQMDVQLKKFAYKTVIAEMIAPFMPLPNRDTVRYKNYMAFHHLSIQLAKWLNLGLYENVMYNGKYGIELSYFNPIIFYRAIEMQLGSGNSKATVGLDLKSNLFNTLQLYSNLVVGEFVLKDFRNYGSGSWLNKQAFQLGGKYIDVLGVKNLDLQAEMNLVRPFMYAHNDSNTALTHYNTELAHPLGANFKEYIAVLQYQPLKRLYLTGKIMSYKKGLDSAGVNMGGDIFRSYDSRPRDYGFYIGTGIPAKAVLTSLGASYELFQNLFFDVTVTNRSYQVPDKPKTKELIFSTGLRWNIGKRVFEF